MKSAACAVFIMVGNMISTARCSTHRRSPLIAHSKTKCARNAYPCKEAAGIVWTYMGPKDKQPLLPNYEWMSMAPANLYVTKSIQDCSWLQGLEGECDSSHLSFLHKSFTGDRPRGGGDGELYAADSAPQLEGIEMDYGIRMLSCRRIGPDSVYLRVSNIVMPCHGFIPPAASTATRKATQFIPMCRSMTLTACATTSTSGATGRSNSSKGSMMTRSARLQKNSQSTEQLLAGS
jgi:phenylpropionate dioxygenase-like ring-hydroxylating dioxygenase large terminal subunit